jgi:hypothetical protein
MIDKRIYLISILVILILWIVCGSGTNTSSEKNDQNSKPILLSTDPDAIKLINDAEGEYSDEENDDIIITDDVYGKMLDVITYYSLKTNDSDKKMVVIYLATFHLFDMNYGYGEVKKLDKKLVDYPYAPNHIEYPEGNMHKNLQKAIITRITYHITSSDRVLTGDAIKDKQILDVYLTNLFASIGILDKKN